MRLLDQASDEQTIAHRQTSRKEQVMFSKWNNMPPIAKWGTFALAVTMGLAAVRAIIGRGRTEVPSVSEVATGGAVGD